MEKVFSIVRQRFGLSPTDQMKDLCVNSAFCFFLSVTLQAAVHLREDYTEHLRSTNSRMEYVKYCIHMRHDILLKSISLNWTSKYVSVKGQIVVKTCQSGSLKFSKYRDIESEVEEQNGKMAIKKTHRNDSVSSREMGQRRTDEGKTTSSHTYTTTQRNRGSDSCTSEGGGWQKLRQIDGDFTVCMRREKTTMKTKREELRI